MRGFPIVSIGTVTNKLDNKDNDYLTKDIFIDIESIKSTDIIIPQFEYDEYYGESIKDIYSSRYSYVTQNGYIRSISILENNLNASSGKMTYLMNSCGFHYNSSYFGVSQKVINIENMRVDSFYVTEIGYGFYDFANEVKNEYIEKLYFNAPNVIVIWDAFCFNFSKNIDNLFINIPKLQRIGSSLLAHNNGLKNLYLNCGQLMSVGSWLLADCSGQIILHALNNVQLDQIYNSFLEYKSPDSLVDLQKGTACNFTDFDVRYWDLWQNTTGKDSGLH